MVTTRSTPGNGARTRERIINLRERLGYAMTGKRLASAIIIISLSAQGKPAAAQVEAAEDLLLTRLLQISSVAEFAWSPTGDQIAYVSNASGTNQIHLLDVNTGDSRQVTRHESAVTDPQWSPDGKSLIFLTDPAWQERYEIWRHDFVSNKEELILANTGAIQRHVRWSPDGSRIALETNAGGNFDVAIRDIADPVLHPLAFGPGDEEGPEWAPTGTSVAFVSKRSIWSAPVNGGDPVRLVNPGLGAAVQAPRWSPDGERLMFRTDQSGFWNIGIYSAADRSWRYAIPEPAEQHDAAWSPDGKQIAYVSTHGFDKRVAITDVAQGGIEYLTDEGTVSVSPRWNRAGDKLAFLMSSPQQTQELWVYRNDRLDQLTHSMADWDSSEFSSPESHSYRSAEGFDVPGLLYKPVNFDPENNYPAVIVIHGGFYGQWVNRFELLGQYLLQRGMVLFYPNPRGGGGYGRMYERLNDGDWGGGDVDDLLRAHDYLKSLPFVDGDRIGIWGGSYGGYLSYALVTAAPGRFQAAVVRAGINDLRSQVQERIYSPGRLNDANSYPRQIGGLPDENPAFYHDRSPLTHVDKVKTPMLIMHGLRDNRVSPNQSRTWVQALRENGVPVVSVEYADDDHSLLRRKSTVRDQLKRMSDLFEEHLHLSPLR